MLMTIATALQFYRFAGDKTLKPHVRSLQS